MADSMAQQVVLYGSADEPTVYCTCYGHEDLVVSCGYCRRRYPGQDVRAVPAASFPPVGR